jgi:hypothetical protein
MPDVPARTRQRRAGRVPSPAAPDRRRDRRGRRHPVFALHGTGAVRAQPGLLQRRRGQAGQGRRFHHRARDHVRCSARRWRARQPLLSPKARPTSSNSAPAPASWRATCSPRWPSSACRSTAIPSSNCRANCARASRRRSRISPRCAGSTASPTFQRRGAGQRGAGRHAGRAGDEEGARLARQYGHHRGRRFA